MKKAGQLIPKETKKFLKTETQKLKRHLLREANNSVTPSKIEENIDDENRPRHLKYHKSFKAGKTYKYNQALSKRVFNASRHGWFIESGRPVARGYKKRDGYRNMPTIRRSKHYKVYGKVIPPFEKIWSDDTEQWVDKMMKEGKL
ncbi:MAG: hypothetical protein HFE63_00995 [Clostridiales bacterium]|nr:hypothetical protein [Clostridiales bacterium]